MPTRLPALRAKVACLTDLLPPPPVYLAYRQLPTTVTFDDRMIELLQPVVPWHFDHTGLIQERYCPLTAQRLPLFESTWFQAGSQFDHQWSEVYFASPAERAFRDALTSYFWQLPDMIKYLKSDVRFTLNNYLSIAFLHGTVNFPSPGISSPHLRGTFQLGARLAGTGYLAIDSGLPNCHDEALRQELLTWFRDNSPLYSDFVPLTGENFDVRLDPLLSTAAVVSAPVTSHQEPLTDQYQQVRLRLKNPDGTFEVRFLPLEAALPLCFPLLFPFPVPCIPGQTLRQKAQHLLAAHPFFRQGRLQCHLILFLYNLIQDQATSFPQNRLSLQPALAPTGANRDLPVDALLTDPSTPSYWKHRQSEVRALCQQFGDPDLMLTFTFVNKWPEVKEAERQAQDLFHDRLDIRFSPVESMQIWKGRFYDIKAENFGKLIAVMGFGEVAHYVWRLEFQARGAPHVHALIWLREPLDCARISNTMFAVAPDPLTANLSALVMGPMIHTCSLGRCRRGDPSLTCRYGFPKPVTGNVHITDSGAVCLPRGPEDQWIVDYSPAFLLKWAGHCHVNILRTRESPDCSPNAIHYIVKYNFKAEPSLRVEASTRDRDTYETLFHARVTSSEEAIARIFSFDYHGCDVPCTFISLKPPDRRLAAFVRGQQVQITAVEKYFARPLELSRLRIQAFFSLYDINPVRETNRQVLAADNSVAPASFPQRPMFSLRDPSWEEANLPQLTLTPRAPLLPSQALPNARALQCHLRPVPAIVLTDKFKLFTWDPEPLAYAILILSGCWRSEEELIAGCASYQAALTYHGLQPIEIDDLTRYNRALIDYMLTTARYSPYEIATTISRMNWDAADYIREKLQVSHGHFAQVLHSILAHLDSLSAACQPVETLLAPPETFTLRQFINCEFTEPEVLAASQLLRTHRPQLNVEQRDIFERITRRLSLDMNTNAFVSGPAGTGKSFLIRTLQAYFTTVNISYVTCASTGIAARLIGGRTVHSTFRIYDDGNGVTRCGLDISRPVGRALSLCRLIIIDEVTMIPKSVLEVIDFALRRLAAQNNSPAFDMPFGGKHVLLFGDLAQVPAVVRARDDYGESANQFFEAGPYGSFSRYGLTRIMRQDPDELGFMSLLNDVRNADQHLTPDSIALLRSRFVPGRLEDVITEIDDFVGRDDPDGMVICFTNLKASLYNSMILARRLPPELRQPLTLRAKFFVRDMQAYRATPGQDPDAAVQHLRTRLATESQIRLFFGAFRNRLINTIVPIELHVCPGARVMLLQNLDLPAGLINGSRGTVVSYIESADTLCVRFDGAPDGAPPTLVTRTSTVELPLARGQHIFMYQFPLKLSWAVTAHKSQGQTLSRIAIDLSDPAFAHGALYVALSRVRSLSSIRLFGLPDFPEQGPAFHINPYIRWEDQRPLDNDY